MDSMKNMEIGQMANYVYFLDDIIYKTHLVQLVSENDEEWRFRIEENNNYHLTVSKKCGFDYSWKSGTDGQIDSRIVITPF